MKAQPVVTLRAVALSEWTPNVGRAFARVGIHQVICCDPGAEIGTDSADAVELARRWNAYPTLVEALKRVAVTGNVRHAVDAANEALAQDRSGMN